MTAVTTKLATYLKGSVAKYCLASLILMVEEQMQQGDETAFLPSLSRGLINWRTLTKFKAYSYNTFWGMRDLSQTFRFRATWYLFS